MFRCIRKFPKLQISSITGLLLTKGYGLWELIGITAVLISAAFLRFYNLGYSDYIGDEHKSFISVGSGDNLFAFFMNQRKGPMQFLVSYIPYLITGDYHNELAQRIPYALISVLAVLVFYLLVKKLTGNIVVAMIASYLLSVNGFMVGFGRISQYQNLNLLFSFLSVYFLYSLIDRTVRSQDCVMKHSGLSAVFFSLSFLSHWDAVYILPVIVYLFIRFLALPCSDKMDRIKPIILFIIICVLILMPFMVPYTYFYLMNGDNQAYFDRRIEASLYDPAYFKFLIDLYNPFITFWFLTVTGLLGVMNIKKSKLFLIWFIPAFIVFGTLFRKPGTHIYNFVIPWMVISAIGVTGIIKLFPRYLKIIPVIILSVVMMFFYYQTYRYFIDTSKEYPWEQKPLFEAGTRGIPETNQIEKMKEGPIKGIYKLLTKETPKYTLEQKLPLFGFPHRRYWDGINNFVNTENIKNNESFGYITNEDKVISDWYMDAKYRVNNGFYIIGIKRPTNFVEDWSFVQFSGRRKVVEFGDKTVVVRIYRVEKEED